MLSSYVETFTKYVSSHTTHHKNPQIRRNANSFREINLINGFRATGHVILKNSLIHHESVGGRWWEKNLPVHFRKPACFALQNKT